MHWLKYIKDEELIAILIGTGYKGMSAQDIAKELFDKYYSIAGLMRKTYSDLSDIKGFKKGKITRIAAAFEITKGLAIELLNKYRSISGMMGKRLSDMEMIKGLGDVKVVRIAAAFEVARRVARALEKE